ncbi:MAG: tail fiber domain-containing protein, partial [Bdellovibrionales bacterium]
GTGLSGGPFSSVGTISLADTAVTAGVYGSASQVTTFNVDQQGRITGAANVAIAIDTSQINQSSAASGQVLKWNGSFWLPAADSDGGITALTGDVVATGPGSVAATIQANAVTTAKILNDAITSAKLNSIGVAINRILMTDGATGSTIGYADACANDEVLKWNSSTGWGCGTVSSSAVTFLQTGTGLSGGPVSSTGTISLADTAVTAGVYGSASQVTTFNVDQQGRITGAANVAIAIPVTQLTQSGAASSQVLSWNGTAWLPADAAATGVTFVAGGTGTTGGSITTTGTINVDVGTGNNQVVQLDGSARLPAVDGSQLLNVSLTAGVNGTLPVANGGTGAATFTANRLLLGNGTSPVSVLAAGTSGQILQSAGAGSPAWSTATFPSTATGTGTILRADGTNWVATTSTFADTYGINTLLYASAANTVSGLATANTSALVTNGTGVPAYTSGTTANRILRTDGTTISFAQLNPSTDITTGTAGISLATSANGNITLLPNGTGKVGVGSASPAFELDVVGSGSFTGSVTATAFYYSSDRRLKENIRPAPGLESIMRLNGVLFDWRKDKSHDVGLIAQEVEEVFPELVAVNPATGFKTVKYGNLVGPLIEASKDLYGMCRMQESQIRTLASVVEANKRDADAKIQRLEGEVEQLRRMNEELRRDIDSIKRQLAH